MDIDDPEPAQPSGGKKKSKGEPVLPLRADDEFGSFSFWKKEILASEQKRDNDYKPTWDRNVHSYLAKPLISAPDVDRIIVPKDFANLEQKKAQLFFQIPLLHCESEDPDLQDAVPLAQAILRFYLSRHRVDAMTTMNEVLFDALNCSAIMCSKIGYESVQDGTKPVQISQPSPNAGQPPPPAPALGGAPPQGPTQPPGSVLGLSAPPVPPTQPIMVDAPRIISERYFWERISQAKILIPENFVGSNFDLAPWLGFEFVEPWDLVKRKYKLSDEEVSRFSGDDDHKIRSESMTSRTNVSSVRGWELYYKAALYDPKAKNPDQVRLLVLLDGYDKPVRHRDCPYQKIDPETGSIMGMKGYPVHVGAIRYVSDMAFSPSETTISRSLVDELGKFRTQMVQLRDRAVPQVGFDPMRIGGPQSEEKIRRGIYAGWIPIPGLDANNLPMAELAKAHANPDSYRANDYIDRDISEVWAFGPNQRGEEAVQSRTATELDLAQQASNTRQGKDRERVVDYFLKGSEKLWALIQMFATDEQYIKIIGQDGVARFDKWDKTKIAGEFVFEAKADSAMQPDENSERMMHLKVYELLAKDPNVNRVEILHKLAAAMDYDPSKLVVDQLPPKPPEPVKAGISFNGVDLDIGRPEFPIVLALLRQSGYQLPDELIAQAQQHKQAQSAIMAMSGIGDPSISAGLAPASSAGVGPTITTPQEHGGMAPRAERLNKHQDKNTGDRRGQKPLNRGNRGVQ
jgi:hypothetical protein